MTSTVPIFQLSDRVHTARWDMKLLVGCATADSSTREIARHLAARLTASGVDACACPVAEVGDADTFEALVLGSAIQ